MLLQVLFLCTLVHTTYPARKRWVGVSSWTEPDNWVSGLPNGCDSALLESNQILNIAGQANIAEVSFSGDSTMVFDSFSEISLSQSRYCEDKTKHIKLFEAGRRDFLSVDNWEFEMEFDDLDVLEIHKIPCIHDEIELPYREMRAELRGPVEVGAVTYGGVRMSKDGVVDWLNSQEGRTELRMLGTASFQINDKTYCANSGGCECGNEGSCNDTNCKVPLPCNDPFSTPVSCCPICGTLLTLPVNTDKSYRQLELELSTVLSHQAAPQLLNMGVYQGELYLLLKQRGDRSTQEIAATIVSHLKYTNYFTDDNYQMLQSSFNPTISEIHQTQHKTTSALIIALGCVVICVVIFGLILIGVIKLRSKQFYPISSEFRPNACNAYDTVDGDQHIYETIRVRELSAKTRDYYPTTTPATRSADLPVSRGFVSRDHPRGKSALVTDHSTLVTDKCTVSDVLIQDIVSRDIGSSVMQTELDKHSMTSV